MKFVYGQSFICLNLAYKQKKSICPIVRKQTPLSCEMQIPRRCGDCSYLLSIFVALLNILVKKKIVEG